VGPNPLPCGTVVKQLYNVADARKTEDVLCRNFFNFAYNYFLSATNQKLTRVFLFLARSPQRKLISEAATIFNIMKASAS